MANNLQTKLKRYVRPLLIVGGFILIGIVVLVAVKAAVNYISAEPEAGNGGFKAFVGKDGKASRDKYVRFGGVPQLGSGMSVSGNKLMKDDQPFLVRGFNTRGVLAAAFCNDPETKEAGEHFDEKEMYAAKVDWNANTIRMQVSQLGLNRPDYQSYLNDIIIPGVKLANSHGFTVILSMQTQGRGCDVGYYQPSRLTIESWQHLVPAVKDALTPGQFRNVMFELFNEPRGPATGKGWEQWRNGGVGGNLPVTLEENEGEPPVGHQAVVNAIRAAGASKNVLVAEGMLLGKILDGVPLLDDPENATAPQIAYAFHGYHFEEYQDEWDARFGNLSRTQPVLMTEWHYGNEGCDQLPERLAPTFLQYLQDHTIGMTPGPFDGPSGTGLIYDWDYHPTDCANKQENRRGSGQLVKDYYEDLAR